jgi:transposase-like protein
MYPAEFRRKVLDLIKAGRSVASVAADLRISEPTIYVWRRQELIDSGPLPGVSSIDQAELRWSQDVRDTTGGPRTVAGPLTATWGRERVAAWRGACRQLGARTPLDYRSPAAVSSPTCWPARMLQSLDHA